MKNAFISGSIIGITTIIWIISAQKIGFYPESILLDSKEWIIYSSLLIPFLGLYFGIKNFKNTSRNRFCFTEAVFQGFKILAVGGLLAALFSFFYIPTQVYLHTVDYMEIAFVAIIAGLLFTFINALLLMDPQKKLG